MKSSSEKPRLGAVGLPRRLKVDAGTLVQGSLPCAGYSLPLMFTPVTEGVDLAAWATLNRNLIDQSLATHGGLLFRGFKVEGQEDFEAFLDAAGVNRMHYLEGATPRREIGRQVYTSTEFPNDHSIALHNELSYTMTWPMKIAFCCLQPADAGGETPIADVRRTLERIPAGLRRRFLKTQWLLARNYGEGLGLPWESVFRTDDKAAVERYCREAAIEWEWKDEKRLSTRQLRPAVATHPYLGHQVWFNHIAFWHASSLDPQSRRMLIESFGENGLPYNTYYGDRQPIEDEVVDQIRRAYECETVRIPWRKGDVLYLDNMLAAHGRGPFSGSRKVIAAMGDAYTRTDLRPLDR